MKKILFVTLALASGFVFTSAHAISLDDIQLWTGSGTNRAALVIEWSTPESLTNSSVPVPIADKTLVWGYRFNGAATATQMVGAIGASDPRLYLVEDDTYGTFVEGIGYNLDAAGVKGITDGSSTNYFTNGFLTNVSVNIDAAGPVNSGDLYWGGYFGPNWEVWNELGDAGGFLQSPNRGTNEYWTADDPANPYSGAHGQWAYAQASLDELPLTNGSWIGFSVAAGEYEPDPTAPYNLHKHAPPSPDGTYVAYVLNTNDFAIQIVSATNIDTANPYNDPTATLNRPTLKFIDHYGDGAAHRTKIIEAPYWKTPDGSNVITEISSGGQITVNMGRRIYDDPNNPYGVDLIVFGNSFFVGTGFASDDVDLDGAELGGGIYGHPTTVSVSQDGTNWFTYSNTATLFPDNAYRWDETNHSWTDEEWNPTKPLNPSVYATDFSGQSAADVLDQFTGSTGGTGYDLKESGFPWIQYVCVEPEAGTYTVIDAIAAVNPVVVGDALSVTPDNVASGLTNLTFQKPDDLSTPLISLNFHALSDVARVSTVMLSDFSSFAPVIGKVTSAYQATLKGTNDVTFSADVSLRTGHTYRGHGDDLHVFQWNGTNWASQPFSFNPTNREVFLAGVTNLSAFVVSQVIPPRLSAQVVTNGVALQFVPVANCLETLERSTDFMTWTPVSVFTATNTQALTLTDTNAPMTQVFYRLVLNIP